MRVVIAGATGFIGKALCEYLHNDYEVIALSRDAHRARKRLGNIVAVAEWDGRSAGNWCEKINGAFAVINLAGENIAKGRWNQARKGTIVHSRLDSLRALLSAVKHAPNKPKVMIQASATGFYGSSGQQELDENSALGKGFLADLCRQIENLAKKTEETGIRCIAIRTGVVLGPSGGALEKFIQPVRLFLGAQIGGGKSWLSWISLDDQVRAIKFLMENDNLQGVFNLTSPQPVTVKKFFSTLGKTLKRPVLLPVPAFAIRAALGQMADETVLASQKVVPKRLKQAGFEFKHPDIKAVIAAAIKD